LSNLRIACGRTHDAQKGERNRSEDRPEDYPCEGDVHREPKDLDPEEPDKETVEGRIRSEPEGEQARRPTVTLAIGDMLDAERFDLEGRAAIFGGAAVRLPFGFRVRGLLRIPG